MTVRDRETRRLRVCHMISGHQWAGAEVQMAHLLAGLARYEDLDLSAILFTQGRLAGELLEHGIAVTVVDERRLGRLGLIPSVARILRTRSVDILHTHRYKENVLGAVAGRWAGVACFVRTQHGHVEPFRGVASAKRALYEAMDRLVGRFGTHAVIAVSHDLQAHLAARLPGRRVALIPNGLHPSAVRPRLPAQVLREHLGLPPGAPVFGTVGRLVPVKGLGHFLDAAQGILDKLPEARFLVVGTGALRLALEQRAHELGIAPSIQFLGFRGDIPNLLNAMDVFVLPSLSEGLPMVLFEAMALGKPIVASAVGGIPEVLGDALAWLVPPGDALAIREACLQAFNAASNGARARATARRHFQLAALAERMWDQTRCLYHALAGHAP